MSMTVGLMRVFALMIYWEEARGSLVLVRIREGGHERYNRKEGMGTGEFGRLVRRSGWADTICLMAVSIQCCGCNVLLSRTQSSMKCLMKYSICCGTRFSMILVINKHQSGADAQSSDIFPTKVIRQNFSSSSGSYELIRSKFQCIL